MAEKIVIIDGNSVFYRSFYALPLLSNENGEYSNAIYGFANQIVKIITEIKPTHIVVAFDAGKHTFRHDMFDGYKATRKPMPDELKTQIAPLREMLAYMKIQFIDMPEFEGDDVIGMLCDKYKDYKKIIITSDRDTLQLIDKNTTIYFNKKGVSDVKVMDEKSFEEEYRIEPKRIIDLKALQGDSSDNIPGAKGIGPKTALDLLQKYGSIENLYNHLDELAAGVRNKLEENRDNVSLSKKLATIVCDGTKLDCKLDEAEYEFPFSSEVYAFMQRYSFRSLLKRSDLFGSKFVELKKTNTQTEKIDSKEKLQNLIDNIEKAREFVLFKDGGGNLLITFDGNTEWVAIANPELFASFISIAEVVDGLENCLADDKIKKILFDSKSMIHYLDKFGNKVQNYEDVSIIKHLVTGQSIKDLVSEDEETLNFAPASKIYNNYKEYLAKLSELGLDKLYRDVELPLVDVLYKMETRGFKVDKDKLDEIGARIKNEILEVRKQIYDLAGFEFNINSPKQLADVLFVKLGLGSGKNKTTNAEALEKIRYKHPIVERILRYRQIEKFRSTYIDGLAQHLDSDNLVHTSFKQTLTNTGRLSSVEPNLQNIPIRKDEGREIRSIFVAGNKNNVLVDADYSQIELRLLAHFSGDEDFINAFASGFDIHTSTAMQVFGVDASDVTSDMRRIAKVVNFGIIYGISEFGLAQDLHTSNKEARELINNFYAMHPKVRDYLDGLVITCKDTGRVTSLLGRTRSFPEITASNFMIRSRAERAAQNMPLQGSAADIIKLAMIGVERELAKNNLKAKLIMQVHDELIVDSPIDEVEKVKTILKTQMENAVSLKVPLVVDVNSAYRWSDAH